MQSFWRDLAELTQYYVRQQPISSDISSEEDAVRMVLEHVSVVQFFSVDTSDTVLPALSTVPICISRNEMDDKVTSQQYSSDLSRDIEPNEGMG